jgi:hypothetical protein
MSDIKINIRAIKGKGLADALKKLLPNYKKMEEITSFAYEQVHERFKTMGLSGGKQWDKNWLGNDANYQKLWEFFDYYAKNNTTGIVYCWHRHVDVQEYGTKKYGGPFPEITPTRAKALFIPITDLAKRYAFAAKKRSARMQRNSAGTWVMVKRLINMTDLRKGRFGVNGLEVWDEALGEYVEGIPDFIFLSKVNIPPRPMLPTSLNEKQALGDKILEICKK